MKAFRASRAREWEDAARQSLATLQRRTVSTSIVGLSMGGALAVLAAAGRSDISALVLIAPYLGMPLQLRIAAATHRLWGRFAGEVNARNPRSIHNPIEREKNLAYGAVTAGMLSELWRVVRRSRGALASVTTPTLVIQSREDPRIAPSVAESALQKLGASEKRIVWTEGAGHIITVDYGRERVFNETERWLDEHTP